MYLGHILPLERITNPAVGELVRQCLLKAHKPLMLPRRLVAQVQHATLGAFHLLQVRAPQVLFSLGVPAQVDLMQLLIVGEEDDLSPQLIFSFRRQGAGRRFGGT